MDTPQTIDCLEWCFGYGGNHLGLKRVIRNLRCIAASEIEAYALANMVAKMEAGVMDPFPVWSDCKTFPCELFRDLVHFFIASYPCTPFSSAGQRKGADDPRHLWPYVRRAVEVIRPRYCFFENVDGHISLGLRQVLTELALLGYRVGNSRGEPTWGVFSAAEVGAPHNRKRVFILAVREGVGLAVACGSGQQGSEQREAHEPGTATQGAIAECRPIFWPRFVSGPGEQQHAFEPPRVIGVKRGLGGGVNGHAANVDRLRLLGNGVYPAAAAKAFVTLFRRLML